MTFRYSGYVPVATVVIYITAAYMQPCTHRNKSATLWGGRFWQIANFCQNQSPMRDRFWQEGTIFSSQNQSGWTNFGSKSGLARLILGGTNFGITGHAVALYNVYG